MSLLRFWPVILFLFFLFVPIEAREWVVIMIYQSNKLHNPILYPLQSSAHESLTINCIKRRYLRLTSNITTLLFGGVRFVLLAIQTNRAFTCCRPIFGYDKWFTVIPSGRFSNDSSITVLSKYHVRFGTGRPEINE